jgi:mannose/cellobiose epimerase-like protein (N-acyl-D-glucosamine 2-epimerase family)/acetyl esterase/lipase
MRHLSVSLVCALLCLPVIAPVTPVRAGDEPPSRDELREQAKRCRSILKTSVVDFYLPAAVDRDHGGYYESLRDGKFAPTGEKFLTLQARQLWFFSTLSREGTERDAALAAAKSGFEFLEGKMRDRRNGGYFSKVTDAGEPKDKRKHVYLNAFALYGLVAYYKAANEPRALDAAKDLFRVLEDKAHDAKHGGYVEFFTEDWRPITDPKEGSYVGPPGTKTYNTHLHVLEALTELYRAWPDPLVKERLAELLVINTTTVHHPDFACNIDGWQLNWQMIETPANLRASYGHDVECSWLALDAARALGQSPSLHRSWAEALCGYALKHGFDHKHGGFFYTGPLGKPAEDTKKEWWVQAEALVAMLEMYRLTGKAEYYAAFRQTLDFVEKHQVAKEGSWWATRAADGSPKGDTRTSPWQGAYHNGRSMLLCAKLLDLLADKAGADKAPAAPVQDLKVRAADQEPPQVALWPDGAPGFEKRKDEKEIRNTKPSGEYSVTNVHNPYMTVFLPPKEKATGAAVVLCPGGGHRELWVLHEGENEAKWLSEHGVAAFVLRYRLGREKDTPYKIAEHALQDGQRAIRLVRSKAKEWNIDPKRVGMMGFSAGGEVTALVCNGAAKGQEDAKDPVERQSARPDFQALIYSGPQGIAKQEVTKEMPPTFIAVGDNDNAVTWLVAHYQALKKAGVSSELHVYANTPHGFGFRGIKDDKPASTWIQRFHEFLGVEGMLKKE